MPLTPCPYLLLGIHEGLNPSSIQTQEIGPGSQPHHPACLKPSRPSTAWKCSLCSFSRVSTASFSGLWQPRHHPLLPPSTLHFELQVPFWVQTCFLESIRREHALPGLSFSQLLPLLGATPPPVLNICSYNCIFRAPILVFCFFVFFLIPARLHTVN
jgi:hypothetical protein